MSVTFEDTGLLPRMIAEDVLRQRQITDDSLIDYVDDKAQRAYRHNESFRLSCNSPVARQLFRMYVEHWIEGEQRRRQKLANLRFQESQS